MILDVITANKQAAVIIIKRYVIEMILNVITANKQAAVINSFAIEKILDVITANKQAAVINSCYWNDSWRNYS